MYLLFLFCFNLNKKKNKKIKKKNLNFFCLQNIHEKIPSDPFEAEMLLMAQMAEETAPCSKPVVTSDSEQEDDGAKENTVPAHGEIFQFNASGLGVPSGPCRDLWHCLVLYYIILNLKVLIIST